MAVEKISISLAEDLSEDLRIAAHEDGVPLSTWVSEAVADRLRARALREFIREYEAEYGAFTEEEMEAARERMGYSHREVAD